MKDTPRYIYEIQFNIVMSKPIKERISTIQTMFADSLMLTNQRIERQNPDMSYAKRRAQLFREMYRGDFPPEKLTEIATQIEIFWTEEEKSLSN